MQPRIETELRGIGLEMRQDLAVVREDGGPGRIIEIAEAGDQAAGVGPHVRPDAAQGIVMPPLAAQAFGGFQQQRLEPLGLEPARGRQPGGTCADDGDLAAHFLAGAWA